MNIFLSLHSFFNFIVTRRKVSQRAVVPLGLRACGKLCDNTGLEVMAPPDPTPVADPWPATMDAESGSPAWVRPPPPRWWVSMHHFHSTVDPTMPCTRCPLWRPMPWVPAALWA